MNSANKGLLPLSILCAFLMIQACSSSEKNDSKSSSDGGDYEFQGEEPDEASRIDSQSTAEVEGEWDITLAVDGMMCPAGCAAPIQAELSSCADVEACIVDFDTKVAYVKYSDASTFTADSLVQIISSVGPYSATVKETF